MSTQKYILAGLLSRTRQRKPKKDGFRFSVSEQELARSFKIRHLARLSKQVSKMDLKDLAR